MIVNSRARRKYVKKSLKNSRAQKNQKKVKKNPETEENIRKNFGEILLLKKEPENISRAREQFRETFWKNTGTKKIFLKNSGKILEN